MNGFYTIIKMNLKLLLRNKGYLAFLVILPVISVIMLNIKNLNSSDSGENIYAIQELSTENKVVINTASYKMNVKVYDSSQSALSEYLLQELAKTGSFRIYRLKEQPMELSEAREKALDAANHNVIGAVVYIPDTFETEILAGKDSNIVVFKATDDGRIELLQNNLNTFLKSIYHYAALTDFNQTSLKTLLAASVKNEMGKKITSIEVGDTLNLSAQQLACSASIGYSLAFLTISFLFCGIFIAATVVTERQNRVYNRFVLAGSSLLNYGLAKIVMVVLNAVMQTGIIAVFVKLLVKSDFGISFTSYLFFVFCLGLAFNLISVVTGVLTNNIFTANCIVFLIWSLSSLFAGLYFPLDGASKWWERASMLMPQRWVVKSAEMLMAGKSGVYSMFILVVISYLVIIMCIGLIGIKIRRKE
jgi:ABC-type multidrug transport system, permease component